MSNSGSDGGELERAPRDVERFSREPERFAREIERPRRSAPPSDPLFDKPYEAPAEKADKPAWEQKATMPSAPVRGLSPNIRSKRKVASLLGGGGNT